MERQTALILTEGSTIDDAVVLSTALIEELVEELPFGHDSSRTELYAVGRAASLRSKLDLPRGNAGDDPYATINGKLHHIWCRGSWYTPGSCPPAPADNNGASAWKWLHFNLMHAVEADATCFLYDIYPLARAEAA
jgi:hypothetical protein